jgi:hypothetical protein
MCYQNDKVEVDVKNYVQRIVKLKPSNKGEPEHSLT